MLLLMISKKGLVLLFCLPDIPLLFLCKFFVTCFFVKMMKYIFFKEPFVKSNYFHENYFINEMYETVNLPLLL